MVVWKIIGSCFIGIRWVVKIGKGLGWLGISLGLIIVFMIRDYNVFLIVLIGWFFLCNSRIY